MKIMYISQVYIEDGCVRAPFGSLKLKLRSVGLPPFKVNRA